GDGMHVAVPAEKLGSRRRDPARLPDELGAPLVHGERAREHARPRVGNAEQLERTLDGAVLAVAAVEEHKGAVEALADERLESPPLGIEGVGVDALLLQRSEHHRAALQRNGALGRAAAHKHGDLAEVARVHAAPPMILTSGTRSIRKRFATVSRASAISASIRRAA